MLDSLRAFSKTFIAKILLAVLVMSFAVFGISNVVTTLGTDTVARVGDEEITIKEFQRAYQQQLNAAAQQLGSVPNSQQAMALGLPSSVLNRLAAEAAVNRMGAEFGLGVSDARLGKMLREDPSFGGTLGQFDRNNFLRVLQQNGFTESEYFDLQTKAARRQQVAQALFADTVVPETAQQLVNRYAADTRTVDYFILNEASLPPAAAPTDAELTAYLAEHQAEYRTTETRNVDLLVLSPEALAATKTIPEADIAAEFERTKASLVTPERRTLVQVALPNDAAVAAFEAGKAAGKTFDQLAAEGGLTPTSLGTLAAAEITDPTLAQTAFALAQGDFAIIPGIAGQRAVSVTAIEPGGAATLETARDDIARSLAVAEARREYVDMLDQVEELRAAFQPLADIAQRFGLPLRQVTLSATGAELGAVPEIAEANRGQVASAIFAAAADKLAPTVQLSSTENIWFDIKGIEAARDLTLDEARDRLVAAITEERTEAALRAEAEKIKGQLDAGTPIADIAQSYNQFPVLSQPMSRNGDGTTVLNASVGAAAFGGGPEHHGYAINGDGDYVIFKVVETVPAAGSTEGEARAFVEDSSRDSLYASFITGLRDQAGLRVNQQALSAVLALDTTGS